jgi:hypothetical protein
LNPKSLCSLRSVNIVIAVNIAIAVFIFNRLSQHFDGYQRRGIRSRVELQFGAGAAEGESEPFHRRKKRHSDYVCGVKQTYEHHDREEEVAHPE